MAQSPGLLRLRDRAPLIRAVAIQDMDCGGCSVPSSLGSWSHTTRRLHADFCAGVNGIANVAAWKPVPDPADIILANTANAGFGQQVVYKDSE